jgi:hypothetical protein
MESSQRRKLVRRLTICVNSDLSYLSAIDGVLGPKRKPVLKPCPSPTIVFTGRKDIISQLHQYFTPSSTSAKPAKQRRFVLYGLGGAGKTQIALKFVEECQVGAEPSRYDHIQVIFSSESADTFLGNQILGCLLHRRQHGPDHRHRSEEYRSSERDRWICIRCDRMAH